MDFFQILGTIGFFSVLQSVIVWLITRKLAHAGKVKDDHKQKQERQHDALTIGMQILLQDRITSLYEEHMDKGYIPSHRRALVGKICEVYLSLGLNGDTSNMLDKMFGLPTEDQYKRNKEVRGHGE